MNKEELLKAIEQKRQEIWPTDTGEMAPASVPNNLEQGWLNALKWMKDFINSLPAEQPSEELEEAAKDFVEKNSPYTDEFMLDNEVEEAYKTAELTFKRGAQWQKEQMMKSSIEVKINRDTLYNLKPIIHEKYQDLKIGDKILIIKEDEQ